MKIFAMTNVLPKILQIRFAEESTSNKFFKIPNFSNHKIRAKILPHDFIFRLTKVLYNLITILHESLHIHFNALFK